MALHNEILVGRFNKGLQKLFGMKGGPPSAQLSSDLQVSHSFFTGNELLFLEGWESFAIDIVQAASVGNINQTQLRNPANSNVIAVVYKIWFSNATVATSITMQYGQPGAADLGTAQQVNVRSTDPRGRPSSTLIASSAQPAAGSVIGSNIFRHSNSPANNGFDLINDRRMELVLPPGSALLIQTGTANLASDCVYWWRERFLEEGERF